jgi:hypothetical protein
MSCGRESRARQRTHDHAHQATNGVSAVAVRGRANGKPRQREHRGIRRGVGGGCGGEASRGAGWCSSSGRGSQGLVRVRWRMLRGDDGGFGAYLLNQAAALWDQRLWVRCGSRAWPSRRRSCPFPFAPVGRPPRAAIRAVQRPTTACATLGRDLALAVRAGALRQPCPARRHERKQRPFRARGSAPLPPCTPRLDRARESLPPLLTLPIGRVYRLRERGRPRIIEAQAGSPRGGEPFPENRSRGHPAASLGSQ